MLFIGGALVPSAPTKRGCTNTAVHAAWIEAEQAAPPIYANVRIINE